MSGALVERHRRTLAEWLSASRIDCALQRLPEDQRREFLEASALSWVRISTLEATFRELGKELNEDPAQLQIDVVKRSVEANVRGIWSILMRLTTNEALVKRLPRIYARAYDGGEVVIDAVGPRDATFHVRGWQRMPEYARRGLAAGTEAVLYVAGRKDVRVKQVPGDDASVTRFAVRWRS